MISNSQNASKLPIGRDDVTGRTILRENIPKIEKKNSISFIFNIFVSLRKKIQKKEQKCGCNAKIDFSSGVNTQIASDVTQKCL